MLALKRIREKNYPCFIKFRWRARGCVSHCGCVRFLCFERQIATRSQVDWGMAAAGRTTALIVREIVSQGL